MVGPCGVLAVGAHPDDIELGCGATLGRLAKAGRTVGILDLTAGESATRGTAEGRRLEAGEAAGHLGARWRECAGLPDGRIVQDDERQTAALVSVLRSAAPRVMLIPHWEDPHPDHRAGGLLCRRSAFLAGVGGFHPELGPPVRPGLVLAYPGPRQLLSPDLVVDVSMSYDRKRAALLAYASQFAPAPGAPTHLASGFFLMAVEGRDRAAGNTIGVEFGEGFVACEPLSGDHVAWMLGGDV